MLVLRLRCQCGTVLMAKPELFGQLRSCPNCQKADTVPIPAASLVKKWVCSLKVPVPGRPVAEYVAELTKLLEISQQLFAFFAKEYNAKLTKELIREITGRLELYRDFLQEAHQVASQTLQDAAINTARALASFAAGYNIGGIGLRDQRFDSYQPYIHENLDCHPSVQLAQDEIKRLRNLLL